VEQALDASLAALARSRPKRVDGTLVLDELRNGIALVSVLCHDGRARLAGDGTLPSISASLRGELAAELRPVIDEHERLWLARNRPGGLPDSRAWLAHLLQCYETGEASLTWSGPQS